MSDAIVLLHGSANGSYSWGQVRRALASHRAKVLAPDMLGYGGAPPPSETWTLLEEVEHLRRSIDQLHDGKIHLVAHSLGSLFALHLRLTLGERVTRMTLLDPVVVSVLREAGEVDGYAEMEAQYQRFMSLVGDPTAAARAFVDHWSGAGAWERIGDKARATITALVPKLRLEMIATRSDTTALNSLAASPPPTILVVGERTRVAPRAVARQLAQSLRAAATVVVPGAGHMLPLTHAAAVAEAVCCVLDRPAWDSAP
ncbi:MAG: alpha/beta fold hydrolase [Deltaproteobacteria bacterium]|nr:alpha/beta fold hydrolase [Deltaproteobacteria bacterium]